MKKIINPPRFFVYKLTVDIGGAPCVTKDLLTLAICKPKIRSAARTGDWIFGFGCNEMDNRLIYIAQVTEKLVKGRYYDKDHIGRGDAIYEWKNKKLKPKKNRRFHRGENDPQKDIGFFPDYKKANVLLSRNFRYFGKDAFQYSSHLKEFIRSLGQGHRSRVVEVQRARLDKLRKKVWRERKKIGRPTHASPEDKSKKCHADAGCAML